MGHMMLPLRALLLAAAALLFLTDNSSAQTLCPAIPVFSPCDIVFDLPAAEAAANPKPFETIDLHAEFRAPSHKTYLVPAFWDGGTRVVLRITPLEPGAWDFRVTSSIGALNGKQGAFTATSSDSPGFVQPANLHHFSYSSNAASGYAKPHLWMGAILPDALSRADVERLAAARATQNFNHLRISFDPEKGFDPAYLRELDERIQIMNRKGITADLVLDPRGQIHTIYPDRSRRELLLRGIIARFAPLNVTWEVLGAFDSVESGRDLAREIGEFLKANDPYRHPRSTGARVSSSPLADDGWMSFITHNSPDVAVGAVERQIFTQPAVNNFATTGNMTDEFRHRLWNTAMNGEYPEATVPDEAAAAQMKFWYKFFSETRHWELEPFFDVVGGRALGLEEVEYIVYVEKPGPVEVQLDERHKYDVSWFNPITGESVDFKAEKVDRFTGEPPDRTHDWVLHLSREGHKASLLKNYKFESQMVPQQEIESDPAKVPFDIVQPSTESLSMHRSVPYQVKLKRETRASKAMLYVWTAEVTADGQSYRILGTGPQGIMQIPANIARRIPGSIHLRVYGLNALGKLYLADRNFELTQ